MKMILTTATTPDEYVACVQGWQQTYVAALRGAVRDAAPQLDERLKWGHLMYFHNGPVLLVRAEPGRVLLGFFRGKRLWHIEPRMQGFGKYELRTLEIKPETPLARETVGQLVQTAVLLNATLGSPHDAAKRR